jgi:CheY-like chemotaxis protein
MEANLTLVLSVATRSGSLLDQSSLAAAWQRFATLAFPHSQASQSDESAAAAMPLRRILVVDDEANVALTLEAGLARLPNCQVSVAASGQEALDLFAQRPFDLLVSDFKMPGMDGLALAGRVRQLYPATSIVLVTAYSSDELRAHAARLSIARILDKPFKISEVRAAALEALRQA